MTFASRKFLKLTLNVDMKTLIKSVILSLITSFAFLITGCSSESTSRVEVRLTDSPGDFDEVNIDIQGVEVNNSNNNDGWVSMDIKKGVYDILQLTNGLDTLLGSVELPAGKIEQIRLILGSDNSVKINGQTFDLITPGSQQSGLKLNLHAVLTGGITYRILLDFEAARSIVKRGNGTYSLKPVIRAIESATSGAIRGAVTPFDATPAIYAISGSDTVSSAFADETGKFLVRGVPAGNYLISLVPSGNYPTKTQANILVSVGNVTDIGTIDF